MPTPNRGQLLIYLFLLCLHLHSLLSYVPSFLSFLHSYPLTSTLLPPSFLTDLSLPLPLLGQCRVSIRQHQSASSPSLTRCFLLLKIPPLPLLPSSPPLSLTCLFLSLFWARAEFFPSFFPSFLPSFFPTLPSFLHTIPLWDKTRSF